MKTDILGVFVLREYVLKREKYEERFNECNYFYSDFLKLEEKLFGKYRNILSS